MEEDSALTPWQQRSVPLHYAVTAKDTAGLAVTHPIDGRLVQFSSVLQVFHETQVLPRADPAVAVALSFPEVLTPGAAALLNGMLQTVTPDTPQSYSEAMRALQPFSPLLTPTMSTPAKFDLFCLFGLLNYFGVAKLYEHLALFMSLRALEDVAWFAWQVPTPAGTGPLTTYNLLFPAEGACPKTTFGFGADERLAITRQQKMSAWMLAWRVAMTPVPVLRNRAAFAFVRSSPLVADDLDDHEFIASVVDVLVDTLAYIAPSKLSERTVRDPLRTAQTVLALALADGAKTRYTGVALHALITLCLWAESTELLETLLGPVDTWDARMIGVALGQVCELRDNMGMSIARRLMTLPAARPNMSGNRLLKYACKCEKIELVRLLLADTRPAVRADPAYPHLALIWGATESGNVELVRLLLDDGRADPTIDRNQAYLYAAGFADGGEFYPGAYAAIAHMLAQDPRVRALLRDTV